jgi:surface antigen
LATRSAKLGKADRACIGHALELAADKRTVVWSDPDAGLSYRLTPVRGMVVDRQKCREFDLTIHGNDMDEKRREKACQASEGTWQPM